MSASGCVGQTDLATISGFYAQMTGVLAGFAFTAVVTITKPTKQPREGEQQRAQDSTLLLVLLAAFIALLITTLTYSVLAGETAPAAKPRAATAELIDGVPFGLAVLMLFHGIARLMEARNVDRFAVWTARASTVVLVPSLTCYYLASGTEDTETARAGNTTAACMSSSLPGHATALSLALPALLAVILIPRVQPPILRKCAHRAQGAAPVSVLVISVVAAIASAAVQNRSPYFLMSPTSLDTYVIGIFVLFALLGTMLALGYGESEQTRPGRGSSTRPKADQPDPPDATNAPAEEPPPEAALGTLQQRGDSCLTDHYLSAHLAIVSIALGVAGITAAAKWRRGSHRGGGRPV